MAFTGFTLPDIKDSDLDSQKERRKILEYLYQLTEQLRYVLSNLDEENLSEGLVQKLDSGKEIAALSGEIKDAYGNISQLNRTAQSLTSRIENAESDISAVEQFADSLTLSVANAAASSTITLKAGSINLGSAKIQFTGEIVFKSQLSTAGSTTINGANITTGTVAAARIDVDKLYVKHLSSDGATFTKLDTSDGSCHLGSDYIKINSVEFGYVKGYAEVSVVPSASGGKGNVGVGLYYWDQVKANRFAEASSIRYKTKIEALTESDLCNIDDIRLVSYELKSKPDQRHIGIIAEELIDILPSLVNLDPEGNPDGIDYARLSVIAIAEIQKLRARVKRLEEITAQGGLQTEWKTRKSSQRH